MLHLKKSVALFDVTDIRKNLKKSKLEGDKIRRSATNGKFKLIVYRSSSPRSQLRCADITGFCIHLENQLLYLLSNIYSLMPQLCRDQLSLELRLTHMEVQLQLQLQLQLRKCSSKKCTKTYFKKVSSIPHIYALIMVLLFECLDPAVVAWWQSICFISSVTLLLWIKSRLGS